MSDDAVRQDAPRPAPLGFWAILTCVIIAAAGLGAMILGVDRWLERRLPEPLLREGPLGVTIWRWLLLPMALAVAWSVGYLLSRLTRWLLLRLARRTRTEWDEALVVSVGAPLTFAWMLLPLFLLLPWLGLSGKPEAMAHRLARSGLLLAL